MHPPAAWSDSGSDSLRRKVRSFSEFCLRGSCAVRIPQINEGQRQWLRPPNTKARCERPGSLAASLSGRQNSKNKFNHSLNSTGASGLEPESGKLSESESPSHRLCVHARRLSANSSKHPLNSKNDLGKKNPPRLQLGGFNERRTFEGPD